MNIWKIIDILLAISAFVIIVGIFYSGSEGGLFGKTKDIAKSIESLAPNITIGAEELKASKPITQEEGADYIIASLKETLTKTITSDKTNCFASFGTLPPLEKGTEISISLKEGFSMLEIDNNQQVVEQDKFAGMIPCVIAGSDGNVNIADNFYNKYLSGGSIDESVTGSYFKPITQLKITYYEGNTFVCINQNVIRVNDLSSDQVNDECNNFESNGWLFKPDAQHICFFPTNYGKNSDEDGIANEWFADEDKGIPNKIQRGELNLCYS